MTAGRPPSATLKKAHQEISSLRERLTKANEAATYWHTQWSRARSQVEVLLALLMEGTNVQSRSASKQ